MVGRGVRKAPGRRRWQMTKFGGVIVRRDLFAGTKCEGDGERKSGRKKGFEGRVEKKEAWQERQEGKCAKSPWTRKVVGKLKVGFFE